MSEIHWNDTHCNCDVCKEDTIATEEVNEIVRKYMDDADSLRAKVAALEASRNMHALNAVEMMRQRDALKAEVQRLNAMIAELREENAVFVDASRRLAALEAENDRLREALAQIGDCKEHPQCTAARAARKALAQQPNPAQDKEQG